MAEYMIEVPHSPEECEWTARSGDADVPWPTYHGCASGTHTTWTIAAVECSDNAWALVPALLRDTARVVRVERGPLSRTEERDHALESTRRSER